MNARNRILARLGASQPQSPPPRPDLVGHYAPRALHESAAARMARFRANIEGYHAEVHLTYDARRVRNAYPTKLTSDDDWPALLARLCREKGVSSLIYGAETQAGRRLNATDFDGTDLHPWTGQVEDLKADLFHRCDAGFTQARGAIADTGTLILWPSPAEPRTLSLVPPIHFVLLDAATIHPTLFDALRTERWADGLPTNVLLISGPSKTADIQQTLAYGAHGPKELIVLVSDAEGARRVRTAYPTDPIPESAGDVP